MPFSSSCFRLEAPAEAWFSQKAGSSGQGFSYVTWLERTFKLCYNQFMEVVSYVRVSTARQGSSGLGLDAQRAAIEVYCQQHDAIVAREYREVESGKRNDRPKLAAAIAHAKRAGAKLVIGKLDRLARNVHFISGLMESGVDFVACDLPEANRLLLHIMAAVAENEAKAISDHRDLPRCSRRRRAGPRSRATNPNSRNLTNEARAAMEVDTAESD